MYLVLMIIHVLISVSLILVILAQSSKGGALDGLVGGAASNVLGGQGASKFLQNATKILAFAFVVSCLLLVFYIKSGKTTSSKAMEMMQKEAAEETTDEEQLPSLPLTEEPVNE